MRWFILLCLALLVALVPAWATNTYVDHTKTGGGNTGADTTNAWLTIVAAVQAAHSGGDTIFVRDTHVETLGSTANVLSDGTPAAPIVLMGDEDSHIWAASTSSVEITCEANYIYWNGDDYWHIDNLRCLLFSVYGMRISLSDGTKITNCTFDQPVAVTDYGIRVENNAETEINNCVFDGNIIGADGNKYGRGVYVTAAVVDINDCSFDGLNSAVYAATGSRAHSTNCEFGQTEVNTNDAQVGGANAYISILSGKLNGNSLLTISSAYPLNPYISRFYADASNRPMVYRKSYDWNSTTDYTTVHGGGGDYSLKVMTNVAAAGIYAPIKILEYAAHCASQETKDYTISARRDAAWNTAPAITEFYLEATYISGAASVSTVVSTQELTNHSTWYDLTAANVTPLYKGPVMLTLWLKTTDLDGAIYVDPRLQTTTDETYHETFLWGLPMANLYMPADGEEGAVYDVLYQMRHHMQIKDEKRWLRP